MRKFWNNMPIAKKFMAITILVFFAFCIIFFIGQISFFEKYYTYIKVSEIKKAVNEFSGIYDNLYDSSEIVSEIAELSDEHDCYIMILDNNGAVRHALSYVMEVTTDSGEKVQLSLDNAAHDKNFSNMELKVGDIVEISYFSADAFNPSSVFFPLSISSGEKTWEVLRREPDRRMRRDKDEMQPEMQPSLNIWNARGEITNLVLPTGQNRNLNAERAAASKAAMDWVRNMDRADAESNEIISYYYTDDETQGKYLVAVKILPLSDGEMIFAISPLYMVQEAVDAATNAYYFWFFFVMAGACVLGIIFSRIVTKPIIEITDITKSMAALDFSRKCEYSANDEMGELVTNINNLSDTLDMTIRQLQAANEKLKADIERERAIEESRREFVAAASHELKTPLGVIRAYIEAIIDGVSENKQSRYMQVIVDETEKMDRLILDMLDNSKLESGAHKMNFSDYDLCLLLQNMQKRFDEVMNHRNINAKMNIPDKPIVKNIDIDMIERVLTNFITNALRNTPDGGTIEYSITVNNDDSATVSVENSGSHIDESDFEYIWDRFYKADKSRRRSAGGTGLGLSIAKNILIMHKAEYGAENTDAGVRFYFTLN